MCTACFPIIIIKRKEGRSALRKLEFVVQPEQDHYKVYDFLRRVAGVSYRSITKLKRIPEGITVNGVHSRTIDRVTTGDIVAITLFDAQKSYLPADLQVPILFEDEDYIVFNKPADMPTHPAKKHQERTLANFYAYHLQENGDCLSFRPVNRLDRDTSGIVIAAKNSHAADKLTGKVEKEYIALVKGNLEQNSGTIDEPISRCENNDIKRRVDPQGQRAITHYQVIHRYNGYTLVKVRLETGRTHQIRVHFSFLGHSLCGDTMYGGTDDLISRQALHCLSASFVHPITGENKKIVARMPDDLLKVLQKLKREETEDFKGKGKTV